jgi:hypothetical protein
MNHGMVAEFDSPYNLLQPYHKPMSRPSSLINLSVASTDMDLIRDVKPHQTPYDGNDCMATSIFYDMCVRSGDYDKIYSMTLKAYMEQQTG